MEWLTVIVGALAGAAAASAPAIGSLVGAALARAAARVLGPVPGPEASPSWFRRLTGRCPLASVRASIGGGRGAVAIECATDEGVEDWLTSLDHQSQR